jgi:hypothetical protein
MNKTKTPTYHRIHWTDAASALDIGVGTEDAPDALIPGVVHVGAWVLVDARHLDEPDEWPVYCADLASNR